MAHSFNELHKAVIHVRLAFCDCGFHSGGHRTEVLISSVYPLMEEDKRFVQTSWWEGRSMGKASSCSSGQGHASWIFNPIFCWWVGLCSLPVVWPEVAQPWSLQSLWWGYRFNGKTNGDLLQEGLGRCTAPPRTVAANALPQSRLLSTHTAPGDSNTPTARLAQSRVRSHHGCASRTIKKAECQRTDAFELWCWRRPLSVSWMRRSNQSILKEINPGYSLEGLMMKLKLQCFGHLMQTVDSLEKTLMLKKIEGMRREWQSLDGIVDSRDMSLSKLREIVKDKEAWHAVVHVVAKSRTRLSDWSINSFIKQRRREQSPIILWKLHNIPYKHIWQKSLTQHYIIKFSNI